MIVWRLGRLAESLDSGPAEPEEWATATVQWGAAHENADFLKPFDPASLAVAVWAGSTAAAR